jgi:hypothetical protein
MELLYNFNHPCLDGKKFKVFFLPFQYNFQIMHIPTRRHISTTGTTTAMSNIGVVLLFVILSEQYVSLLFEHTGFPSNLV